MKNRVKNRKDPRYLRTQDRYDSALGRFLKRSRRSRLTITELSDETKVNKSTFYDHFIHMDAAFNQLPHKFKGKLEQLRAELGTPKSTELIFIKLLTFIYENREYYGVMIYDNNPTPFLEMLDIFRVSLMRTWSNYGPETNKYVFQIFSWEATGELFYWGKNERFVKAKLPHHVNNLVRLCQNATQRLGKLPQPISEKP